MNNDPTRSSNAPRKSWVVTLSAIGILVLLAVVGKVYSALSDLRIEIGYAQEAADEAQRIAQEAKDIAEDAQSESEEAQSTADEAQSTADEAQSTADEALSKAEDAERQLRYR